MLHLENLTKHLLQETLSQVKKQQQKEASKSVLAIITAGLEGSEEAFMALRTLREQGYWVTVIPSKGALELFGLDYLKANTEANRLVMNREEHTPKELIETHSYIIVPILTSSSLGKLVNGIWDTYPLYIMYKALLQNKEIVAAENAALPFGGKNQKIIRLIEDNKKSAEEFGIKWVDVNNIIEHIPVSDCVEKRTSSNHVQEAEPVLDKKVITLDDVKNIGSGSLRLKAGTIITPLARDYARDAGIKIESGGE